MRNFENLLGKTFNSLTVIEFSGKNKRGKYQWLCKCDCGNERIVTSSDLKTGHIKSCGCYKSLHNEGYMDLIGQKFNKLKVIERVEDKNHKRMWLCECECGNRIIVCTGDLRNGHTKSCGCLSIYKYDKLDITNKKFGNLTAIEKVSEEWDKWLCKCSCGEYITLPIRTLIRGNIISCGCIPPLKERDKKKRLSNSRLYNIWANMKQRCSNPNATESENYYYRGIKVCDEWVSSFECFYIWANENGYTDDLTIERIDVNGNYEPSNCTWIPLSQQGLNKTTSHLLTYNGKTKPMSSWAKELGINYGTLNSRINDSKWSVEKALNK